MSPFSSTVYPQSPPFCPFTTCFSSFPPRLSFCTSDSSPYVHSTLSVRFPLNHSCLMRFRFRSCATTPSNSNTVPDDGPYLNSDNKTTRVPHRTKVDNPGDDAKVFPSTIPRKPRKGRRSEAVAVEDFVRNSLESTFASIREQNPDICIEKERLLKETLDSGNISDDDDDDDDDDETDQEAQQMVVEEDSPNWPLDADIGWGTRASEYFEKHAIKNVVGEDGTDIDWEGEIDDNWVQEINCLQWESFAFHPSPLVVLVFERYNRASDNWKVLKELENALKVYWNAKDRLPPRAVKLDINIERDLAYALKVRECPQILFLRGQRLLYRETEFRKAEDLVQMIAFFYYNAKKPSWIDEAALAV